MTLDKILIIIQVVLGVLLMAVILIQARGASLGEAFGGSSTFYGTRRGSERTLFTITIVIAAAFVVVALVSLLL
ncbi:preprotein translocase subunit SecG [candidate division Kazan bacterium RIFCSPHIGHO2_01_FULL_49_10]|nr:MAG: preprotein translocase subunit SecG [candidate division Kazan bacterium RIFCSPHIGHO2_01_FULL_49_10]